MKEEMLKRAAAILEKEFGSDWQASHRNWERRI